MATEFFDKYNTLPTKDSLLVDLESIAVSDEVYKDIKGIIKDSYESEVIDNIDYLTDLSEQYCQEKALYNALLQVIDVVDGNGSDQLSKFAVPDLLRDALGVTFDEKIGHEYNEQFDDRYEYYTNPGSRIPFGIKILDDMTRASKDVCGIPKKTLTCFSGGSGTGKTLMLCHLSAFWKRIGLNVLYITLEMSEMEIGKRIDANLMDIEQDEISNMSKEQYDKRLDEINSKCVGEVFIKLYPTGAGHSGHFRHLIQELKAKKNFKPDILVVDYLGICASARVKSQNANSNTIQKSIAEELRSLGIENDIPVVSAVQLNRGGMNASDVGMTDTADSIGVPFTLDIMFALITDDEMRKLQQMIAKAIKNRFGPVGESGLIGVNYKKMKIFDVEQNVTPLSNIQPATLPSNRTKEKFKSFNFN